MLGDEIALANRASAGENIGELLLREGLITNAQLDDALDVQRSTDQPLVRILVDSGTLDETRRLNFFKRHYGVPVVTLASTKIDSLIYTYIPGHIARRHHLVPVKLDKDGLVVAMEDPSDILLLDNLKEIVGLRIKPVIAPTSEIAAALMHYPEEKPAEEEVAAAAPQKFDGVTRLLSVVFLPLMSGGVLLAIFLLLGNSPDFQRWIKDQFPQDSANKSGQVFTLFLYFFLSWGVWTILMYEIAGLVFDDMQWREADEVGEPRSKGKARLLSIFLGFLGLDRFYLGYTRMGILKLITLGMGGIWWLMDAILLLGPGIPDAAGRPLK